MSKKEQGAKSAIVQGEFHLSNKDANSLLNRDLEEWDVLLVEGRESVYKLENSELGFSYYSIGAITLRTIVLILHKVLGKVGISSTDPIEQAEVPTYNRIDAQHREIWGFTSRWLRVLLLSVSTILSVAILLSHQYISGEFTMVRTSHLFLIFFPILPSIVHVITIVNPTNSIERNKVMVRNIINYTSENQHEKVLVLVGEMHRAGIAESLEEQGWNVTTNQTHSRVGKLISLLYKLFGDWKRVK
jgi:hypothetical protein